MLREAPGNALTSRHHHQDICTGKHHTNLLFQILVNSNTDLTTGTFHPCAQIGRIDSAQYQSSDPDDIKLNVTWYYRPEEVDGGRKVSIRRRLNWLCAWCNSKFAIQERYCNRQVAEHAHAYDIALGDVRTAAQCMVLPEVNFLHHTQNLELLGNLSLFGQWLKLMDVVCKHADCADEIGVAVLLEITLPEITHINHCMTCSVQSSVPCLGHVKYHYFYFYWFSILDAFSQMFTL